METDDPLYRPRKGAGARFNMRHKIKKSIIWVPFNGIT